MPKPKEGESRKDFMARCVPIVMEEGDGADKKEAAGKCGGIYDSAKRNVSFNDMVERVSLAWIRGPGSYEGEMPWSYPIQVYQKHLIVKQDARYYKVPYSTTNDGIEFGDPKKVEMEFRNNLVRRVINMPIRAEGGGAPGVYRAYGVLFGSEGEKDLYGTFFDAETKLHLDWYDRRPWLHDHGQNRFIGREAVGTWEEEGADDVGVFFRGELNRRHKYVDAMEALLDGEHLFPSQGTARHLMSVAENGHVDEWGLIEVSSTTSPGNFRQQPVTDAAIRAFRLLGGIDMAGDSDVRAGSLVEEMEPSVLEAGEETSEALDTTLIEEVAGEVQEEEEAQPEPVLAAPEILEAIRAIDGTLMELHKEIKGLTARMNAVEQSDAEKVKEVVEGRGFLDGLWAVSRSGSDVVDADKVPTPPKQGQGDQGFGSILSQVMGDGGLTGGSSG